MRAAALAALAFAAAACSSGLGSALTPDELRDACITATACGVVGPTLQGCLASLFGVNEPEVALAARITPDQVRCLQRAGSDCLAATHCLPGLIVAGANCSGTSCSGSVSHACFNSDLPGQPSIDFDCAQLGLDCVSTASAACGIGTCAGNEPFCDGTFLVACTGAQRKIDCAAAGATCGQTDFGGIDCVGTGAACTLDNLSRCENDDIVTCLNGTEARTDCGQVNAHCLQGAFDFECGFDIQCTEQFQPTCAGRFVVFCNHGRIETVDCLSRGFLRGCDPNFAICSR